MASKIHGLFILQPHPSLFGGPILAGAVGAEINGVFVSLSKIEQEFVSQAPVGGGQERRRVMTYQWEGRGERDGWGLRK